MTWKLKELFSRKASSVQPTQPTPSVQPLPAAQPGADDWFQRGNVHVSQQQWQSALDCYREAARVNPNHAEAHAYTGNVLRQLRQPDAALAAYDRAVAVKPDYVEVHYNRGALLLQARQAQAALDSFDRALSINPSFTEAHCSRGDVLKELGRMDESLASYNAAITLNGGYWRAYLHRGILQQQLQLPDAAEASYQQAIALKPDSADAHAGRGLALMVLGQTAAAVDSFNTAIRLKPDFARAFSNRAQAQVKLGLLAEARASHDQAVSLDPRDAALHFNRGAFLSDRKEWQGAIESYQAAIALNPNHADAWCNLGLAQQELGQSDAALDSYSRALAINPALAAALNNRGNLFRSRQQFAPAMQDFRQAFTLNPNSAEAHYNFGQVALLQGDFAAGWLGYAWRGLTEEGLAFNTRTLPQPAWTGEQSLEGKHIFLHAEQGLGDTIQFCRYVSLVAGRGARVTLEVQPTLGDLLAGLDGVAELVLFGAPVPPADYQCSIMSLPGAFKTTLATIPCPVPYLHADPRKVTRWHEILGPRARPRIGLTWSGNPRHSNDLHRSINLAQWLGYLPDEYEYVCLQNQIRDTDRPTLQSCSRIINVESHLENFTDTAALLETLDLIISVDTSLAHLSGAMGKKTWVLLPYLPDWRWQLDRTDSPWYPTATLYRQTVDGDWDSVLAAVKQDLLRTMRPSRYQT